MRNEPVRREIDEERAAMLLGLDRTQLRKLSEESGLSHTATEQSSEQRFFTYEELYRLCRWAMRPAT